MKLDLLWLLARRLVADRIGTRTDPGIDMYLLVVLFEQGLIPNKRNLELLIWILFKL